MERESAKIIKRATYKMALDDPDRAAEIAHQCIVNDDYEDVVATTISLTTSSKMTMGRSMEIKEILGQARTT
jgi:hypothetical protein